MSDVSIILQEVQMAKNYLLILSIVLVVMGVLTFFRWPYPNFNEPLLHTVAKVLLGIVGIWIAFTEKK
jgi:phosphatidylserine synthase